MIEYIGLENIIWALVVVVLIMAYQLDRFSKHTNDYIDQLQDRVGELEKRLGI